MIDTMRHSLIISFVTILLVMLCTNTSAAQDDVDREVHSCIQIADGYAFLSEDMTLGQCRQVALANAKKAALESVKTYVQSKTKVKNYKLEYDNIWSETDGAMRILEQKDLGVENNTRYHSYRLKGKLETKHMNTDSDHVA